MLLLAVAVAIPVNGQTPARLVAMTASANGVYLATADAAGVVKIREAGTGELVAQLLSNVTGGVSSVGFSGTGDGLWVLGFGGQADLWNWASEKRLNTQNVTGSWRGIVSREKRTALIGDTVGVRLENASVLVPPDKTRFPTTADFSPDGSKIALGWSDGQIEVRDAASGALQTRWRASAGWVNALIWTSAGILSGNSPKELELRTVDGTSVWKQNLPEEPTALSAASGVWVVGMKNGQLESADFFRKQTPVLWTACRGPVLGLQTVLPGRAICLGADSVLSLWDLSTGKSLGVIDP